MPFMPLVRQFHSIQMISSQSFSAVFFDRIIGHTLFYLLWGFGDVIIAQWTDNSQHQQTAV